jgi:PAS domain S-box-containing protein
MRAPYPGVESTIDLNGTTSDQAASQGRWIKASLVVAIGFVVTGVVELDLVRATGASDPVLVEWLLMPWAPLGIAVSVMVICGNARSWPGVFAGSLIVNALTHLPTTMMLTQASGSALCAAAIYTLLRRWRFNPAIERWQDSLMLWSAAAIGAVAMAAIGVSGALASGWLEPSRLQASFTRLVLDPSGHLWVSVALLKLAARWCLNWTTGVALLVPCLYGLVHARRQLAGLRATELAILIAITAVWSVCAFAQLPWILRMPLALVGLLLVTWPAVRFGATLTSLMTLVLAYVTSAAYMFGRGPVGARPEEALANAWAFIIMVAVLGLVITSLLAERNTAARLRAASEARYRTLFESSPQPLWVQDRDSKKILMVNQAAVARYGYTREQLMQMTLADLESSGRRQSISADGDVLIQDGGEYLHTTREGEQISVELRAQPLEFGDRNAELVFSHDVTDRNRMRTALLDSTDRAERQLSRELHDGLGPDLAALSLFARALRTQVDRGELPSPGSLEMIEKVAQRAVATCRGIAHGLSALGETGGNFYQALRSLPERFQHDGPPTLDVTIKGESPLTLPEATQHHILRVAQEAVANALKHARAQHVEVVFENSQTAVTLIVRDDGVGLPPVAKLRVGLGRASMRYRASAIGGGLYIKNLNNKGTEVRLECAQRARPEKRPEGAAHS